MVFSAVSKLPSTLSGAPIRKLRWASHFTRYPACAPQRSSVRASVMSCTRTFQRPEDGDTAVAETYGWTGSAGTGSAACATAAKPDSVATRYVTLSFIEGSPGSCS